MKSNYRRIGDYIKPVKVLNSDLRATELLGINIDKFFMPSVANVVGTDLSRYKIIEKNQFACNRMHVGRDYRIPVALSDRDEPFMVSPAYDVFEIKDTSILDPEYLMMWFSRAEFDRNAWFYTDSDVRGGLAWKAFCGMQLPVPDIEKQREIVKDYNTIVNRIKLNEQLNQKLEETAQAIYKHWFVDFEFPDENGKPYKSSGGEMVWNDKLEKEIPKGWEVQMINSICEITSSKRIFESEYSSFGVPFYRGKEITQKKSGKPITEPIFISKERYNDLVKKYGKPNRGDILMTAVGTIGSTYMVKNEEFYFKDGNVIWFKNFSKEGINYYLYDFMQSEMFFELINEITIGSTQNAITIKSFGEKNIIIPKLSIVEMYIKFSKKIQKEIELRKLENQNLFDFYDVLLSKMTKIEN